MFIQNLAYEDFELSYHSFEQSYYFFMVFGLNELIACLDALLELEFLDSFFTEKVNKHLIDAALELKFVSSFLFLVNYCLQGLSNTLLIGQLTIGLFMSMGNKSGTRRFSMDLQSIYWTAYLLNLAHFQLSGLIFYNFFLNVLIFGDQI